MTFEIPGDSPHVGAVEDAHDELATDHGSDNVFVTAVDGEVVTVVGEGIGTIEEISVTTENPAAATGQEATTETPPSLDTGLFALFEEPRGWFEDVHDQFEMSVGGIGTICHLDQHGVSFQSFRDDLPSAIDHYQEMNQQDTIGDAVVVADSVEAEEAGERATWMQFESDRRIFVHEWVPFDEPATTKERLQEELEEIMVDTPDFDQLFDQTREVFPYNMEPRHAETEAAE